MQSTEIETKFLKLTSTLNDGNVIIYQLKFCLLKWRKTYLDLEYTHKIFDLKTSDFALSNSTKIWKWVNCVISTLFSWAQSKMIDIEMLQHFINVMFNLNQILAPSSN